MPTGRVSCVRFASGEGSPGTRRGPCTVCSFRRKARRGSYGKAQLASSPAELRLTQRRGDTERRPDGAAEATAARGGRRASGAPPGQGGRGNRPGIRLVFYSLDAGVGIAVVERYPVNGIWKPRQDIKRTAHRCYDRTQRADADVATRLHSGDAHLPNVETFRHGFLCEIPRATEFPEPQAGQKFLGFRKHFGRRLRANLAPLLSGHQMRCSPLSSSRYSSYRSSAIGTYFSYHRSSPVLSPPRSKIAVRRGSKAYSTRYGRPRCWILNSRM